MRCKSAFFLPSLGGKLTQIQVRGVNRQFLPNLGGKLTQMPEKYEQKENANG